MSSQLETSRMGLHHLISVDVKSTRNNENGITPSNYCNCKKSTRKNDNGITPVNYCKCKKSTRNIKNEFTSIDMLKSLYAVRMCFN